jgi:hypothetical protein
MRTCNCKAAYIAAWKLANKNPLASLNEDKLIMKCDVVVFSTDAHGAVTATVWDCARGQFVKYEQAVYHRLKHDGLVP